MTVLEELAGHFLAPEQARPRSAAPAAAAGAPVTGGVAVVGRERDARLLAAALAGELRARRRARTALVLSWQAGPGPRHSAPPAVPSARRLAARLAARELDAVAYGRLVGVSLSCDPAQAMVQARRAWAATQAPSVLSLGGPRPQALEALLDGRELIVVAACAHDGTLAELAEDELGRRARDVVTVLAPARAAGWMAAAGVGRMPSLRPALDRLAGS